jgi:Co/Zn/Cd efflux system component
MTHCCPPSDDLLKTAQRRRVLWLVLAINATMFLVELGVGLFAGSVALQADSLDMLGDTLVYGFSLAVVGRSLLWRARAAQLKGVVMLLFGLAVLGQVALKVLRGVPPDPTIVSATGALALAANAACLGLLFRHRADDINMHSTWVCSRNDILANAGVILSGAGVAVFASIWPDVVVSLAIVALFLRSARNVLAAAELEITPSRRQPTAELCPNGTCSAAACQCPAA